MFDYSDCVFADVESRSEVDITKVGPYVYFEHPSTEVICVCWALGPDMEPELWLPDMVNPPEWEFKTFVAHNKDTEREAFRQLGLLDLANDWIDTASLSSLVGMPRNLEDITEALHMPDGKLSKRAMLALCKPQKKTKKRPLGGFITKEERPDLYEELYVYCKRDVHCMQRIVKLLPPLDVMMPERERRLEKLTDIMNDRGLDIDMVNARKAKAVIDQEIARLMPRWNELMPGILPKSPVKVAAAWDLPNVAADTVRDAMKHATGERLEAMELRADITKSSVAKLDAIFERVTSDDKVHGAMVYQGAGRTGRWTSMGLQVHNFPSGAADLTDAIFEALEAYDTDGGL